MTSLILTAWVMLAVAAISPGPNLVAVASRGLGSGRQSALMVASGLAFGALCWSVLTAVGLSRLFLEFPNLLTLIGILGGNYLCWLGFKGWRAAIIGRGSQIEAQLGQGAKGDFLYGLMVTASNPKVALLWVSLSTFVSPALELWPYLLLYAVGSSCIIFTIYGTYGMLFSTGYIRKVYHRFQKFMEALFGSIFMAIGIVMIYQSIIALAN